MLLFIVLNRIVWKLPHLLTIQLVLHGHRIIKQIKGFYEFGRSEDGPGDFKLNVHRMFNRSPIWFLWKISERSFTRLVYSFFYFISFFVSLRHGVLINSFRLQSAAKIEDLNQCATGYPVPANPSNIFQSGSGSGSGQILAGLAGFLKIIQKFSKMLKM